VALHCERAGCEGGKGGKGDEGDEGGGRKM
jgi:hypothetical protein